MNVFLSNDNKNLLYELFNELSKKHFQKTIHDIPNFETTYNKISTEISKNYQDSSNIEKNKLVLTRLFNSIKEENKKNSLLKRKYDTVPLTKEKINNHMSEYDNKTPKDVDFTDSSNYETENTDVAYDNILQQREMENKNILTHQKKDSEQAKEWLQQKNTKLNIDYDSDIKNDTMIELNQQVNKKQVTFKKNITHDSQHFITASTIENNNIQFNNTLGYCDNLCINHILIYDNIVHYKNELGLIKKKYISEIPFIFVNIKINNTTISKVPFFQNKMINSLIYFTSKQKIEVKDLITKIELNIFDSYRNKINMNQEIIVEEIYNASVLEKTEKINKIGKEFYNAEYKYIKFNEEECFVNAEDMLEINNKEYSIMGLCKLDIENPQKIFIIETNQEEDYNTIIIKIEDNINKETKIINKSRTPLCLLSEMS